MSSREEHIYLQAYVDGDGRIGLQDQHGRTVRSIVNINLSVGVLEISRVTCEIGLHSKDGELLMDGQINDGGADPSGNLSSRAKEPQECSYAGQAEPGQ